MSKECKCPKGYPREQVYAWQGGIPHVIPMRPRYVMLGHTGECPLYDEFLRVYFE